jgi:hypothetical protein
MVLFTISYFGVRMGRCSPEPGQNGPSTTATHIIIHGKSVYDAIVDELQLKIPNGVN